MRILITGGAGFIGSHVAEAAVAAGHQVAVLDDLSSGRRENVPSAVPLFEVDLRDRRATRNALAEFRPDVVSHQAAQASVSVSMRDPALDAEVNVLGGIHVADACVELGVRHLVFASTGGAIYGEVPEGTAADESHGAAPISPYAIHKLAFEQLLGVYRRQHGLHSTVLRYANVYGPRQDPHGEAGVVAIFLGRALTGEPLQIFARRELGDPGCVRDYVFVSDVARANLAVMEGTLAAPVLNCATGVGTSTAELASQVLGWLRDRGQPAPELRHGPPRAGDLERSVLDASRFRELLGAPVPLAEGIRRTADWYAKVG
jgi:UDP-glucose 4-epimerase